MQRLKLSLVLLLLLLAILLLFFDEIVLLHTTGILTRSLDCLSNEVAGAAAQRVCIKERKVVKIAKPCTSVTDVMQCKWKHWKQVYTNYYWGSIYDSLPLFPKIIEYDSQGGGVVMERAKHNTSVKPDYAYNLEQMKMFDDMLKAHNQIAMDVRPETNVLLDDDGRIHIVDFNLLPWWGRPYIERYERRCARLSPFQNIYGNRRMFKWLTSPSQNTSNTEKPTTHDLHLRGTGEQLAELILSAKLEEN